MRIKLQDVCFSYGKNPILKHIDFQAEEGRLIAVLGPNGAGKSTLFRCILGFFKNYSGDIQLDGEDLRTMTHSQIASKIAYIPQSSVPVFNYDVLDVVLMGMTGKLKLFEMPKEEQVKQAKAALEELGIGHLMHRGFGRLSGGERQLVLIARALVQQANIIIMDEPTANLDYGNQYRVMQKVRKLTSGGYTIMMATHNPEHALLFADDAFVLQKGQVVAAGCSEQVVSTELMEQLYGVKVQIVTALAGDKMARTLLPMEL